MDLEKLNNSYEKAKQNLENKKKAIEKLEENLQVVMEDLIIARGEKIIEQRENDWEEVKFTEQKIKDKERQIKEIQQKAEEEKEEMQMFQEKVDKIIEEIKEDPQMKQHLEQVIAKRYGRENKKIDKEVKEVEKKKEAEGKRLENIEVVETMMQEHPTMKNHMQGMLNASASIQRLEEELSQLDMVKNNDRIKVIQKEIQGANKKLENNRDAILTFSNKNKLGITKETLEAIMQNVAVNEKTGQVNVKNSLANTKNRMQRKVKNYDKEILGYHKKTANNQRAMMNLGYSLPREGREEENANIERGFSNQVMGVGTIAELEKETETEQKPKWFQFIKRFKQWLASKKMSQLPNTNSKPEAIEKEEKNEFSKSLKYQVVKDIAKQMQEEKIKEAKQQAKQTKEIEK